jgi:ubiquinone/menaquinone biosynthesis C-methylase UbiE
MQSIINIITSKNPNLFFTKLVLILGIILALIILYKISEPPYKKIEGFTQKEPFLLRANHKIYDDFYTDIYDELYDTKKRVQKELVEVLKMTEPTVKHSSFLDIGSGTGYMVDQLTQAGYKAYGIDKSDAMVKYSENKYPESEYTCGDVLDPMTFEKSSFTHILCTNFTLYLLENRMTFFNNCYFWLKPNGYLVVHLVNRHKFSIYKPVAKKPLYNFPSKALPPRITNAKVDFDDYNYISSYQFPNTKADKSSLEEVIYKEKFVDKTTKHVRQNEQVLYMDSIDTIVKMANTAGFTLKSRLDMTKLFKKGPHSDRFQYIYIFERTM